MAAAIILITIGGIMMVSAVEGISITDVLKGVAGGKINPKGGSGIEVSTNDTPDTTGGDITKDPLSGLVGTTTIDGQPVANWIARIVIWARTNSPNPWHGTVTSGVRTIEQQRQACIHVCGNPGGCPGTCAKPGESNHQGKLYPLGAVDVTDPAGFERAIASYPGGPPLIGNGKVLPNDPVHFSHSGN